MKKFVCFAMTLLLAASLAACGSSGNQPASGSANDTSVSVEAPETSAGTEDVSAPDENLSAETEVPATEETPSEEKEPDKDKPSTAEKDTAQSTKPDKEPGKKPAASTKPSQKPSEKPAQSTDKNETSKPNDQNSDQDSAAEDQSVGQMLHGIFVSQLKSNPDASTEDLANAIVESGKLPMMCGTMPVEPGYINGFDADITGFESCTFFGPMISSIPFTGYIFELAEDADTKAFVKTLKANANLNWNICTTADEMVCKASGQKVFFVMCPTSFDN